MTHKDMQFRRITHLRGPNIWTYRPVIEALIDIGTLEQAPSNTIPGFFERLTAWLPGLIEHRCGIGERGGFLERLREGTWAAHILEHVVLELQNLVGMKTGFGKTRSVGEHGVYKMAFRTRHEQVGRACLTLGHRLLMAAINDQPFDLQAEIEPVRDIAESLLLGPSTANIVDAATDRRIPSIRLTDGNLVQLGYGARQRRIWTAETDSTSAIAEGISSDKDLTKSLLKSCGVPVPEGRLVDSPADAWEAAEDIGLPVVVKPYDGNHGRGVFIELETRDAVERAYAAAMDHGSGVIVERFVRGNEHRLLVVGGRVVAAARGEAAWVKGDGRANLIELVETQLNSDPRRGKTEDCPLNRINIEDDRAAEVDLERQGLTIHSVPEAGREVLIQRCGNVAFDVTDLVHPDVADRVALAARIVGLDIAGVDLVTEDITKPLEATNGAIVEVNAGPGLLMHLRPAAGHPRPVGRAIVDHLFPGEDDGRIPVVGISGNQGTALAARLVAWLLQLSGYRAGLASQDGLYLEQRAIDSRDASTWESGQRLLINRVIDAAVFEHSPLRILSEGLAYDRCQVGVVTDSTGIELLAGMHIHEPEQLANVLRTQVDIVLPEGTAVLNGDDPLVAALAEHCDGSVILFAHSPDAPTLADHLGEGGRAVYLRGSQLTFANGAHEQTLLDLAELPDINLADAAISLLAASAAAWALGLDTELIATGIETFATQAPPVARRPPRLSRTPTNV